MELAQAGLELAFVASRSHKIRLCGLASLHVHYAQEYALQNCETIIRSGTTFIVQKVFDELVHVLGIQVY